MSDQPSYDLLGEARARFGELSAAEEKVLHAVARGEVAYCGPSDKDDDPANDPAKAAEWGKDRTVRARLIRWLCIDAEVSKTIDPRGIRVHGASIGGLPHGSSLDLVAATVGFPLYFFSCNFDVPIELQDARIRVLVLHGSRVPRLNANRATVSGSVLLRHGFRAEGEVSFAVANISGNLDCTGGSFRNKGDDALLADGIKVAGDVFLRGDFSSDGEVRFAGADIGGQFIVQHARFGDVSRVLLFGATVKQTLAWIGLDKNSPVRLDLRHASVGVIGDDEQSWPRKGNLLLDGFVYEKIGEGPTDAGKRLQWLARQPDGFVPQPYRQLAKVLREAGDDAGARDVLIAMENARLRHGTLSFTQRVVAWILRLTVGYGYKPLRALWYIAFFVLLGTMLFSWGRNSNVIVAVTGKYTPAPYQSFNPFVYSLENFLPLVNLRMAEYWMPDANAAPTPLLLPFSDTLAPAPLWLGSFLRWYLWLHILLGWFFASMLIAGVTGLVRRE